MSAGENRQPAFALATLPAAAGPLGSFAQWRDDVRARVTAALTDFVGTRCVPDLRGTGVDVAADVLTSFVDGGKGLRSTFMYLGWLCGAADDDAALRAAASLELLHTFALMQDDVMDRSGMRRGRPAAHVRFAGWHRARGLSGAAGHFGDAAAVLLADLCLVWAEQMLRGSGLQARALARAWPRYDQMRTELAVGQFADLVNDATGFPSLDDVLDVARRKSGNYTVRRPLELGAELAGCAPALMTRLGGYGEAVGEAFQLRDDLLGVFGAPTVTGKPAGADLAARKATSVVVAAHHLADSALRAQLTELMLADELTDADLERWRALIDASGAVARVEQMIDERVDRALELISTGALDETVRTALAEMAKTCAERAS